DQCPTDRSRTAAKPRHRAAHGWPPTSACRYPGSHRTHPAVRARRAQPFDRVSRPCSSSLYVTDGALLDALLGIGIHHNAVNVDTGQVDLVRIESAGLNDLFHFDHGDLAGHGDVRIEVAGRATEQQVAGAVGLPGF